MPLKENVLFNYKSITKIFIVDTCDLGNTRQYVYPVVARADNQVAAWIKERHLCIALNAQERGKPGAVYPPQYPGLLVPWPLQLGQGNCGLGIA